MRLTIQRVHGHSFGKYFDLLEAEGYKPRYLKNERQEAVDDEENDWAYEDLVEIEIDTIERLFHLSEILEWPLVINDMGEINETDLVIEDAYRY